jgi:hypothetical protein
MPDGGALPKPKNLPKWAWGVAIIGGLVVGYFLLQRKPSTAEAPQGAAEAPPTDAAQQPAGIPLADFLNALGMRGGAAPPGAGGETTPPPPADTGGGEPAPAPAPTSSPTIMLTPDTWSGVTPVTTTLPPIPAGVFATGSSLIPQVSPGAIQQGQALIPGFFSSTTLPTLPPGVIAGGTRGITRIPGGYRNLEV